MTRAKIDSGNVQLNGKIDEWLDWDRNETTLNEIQTLIDEKQWETLKKRLCDRLKFGTAGLRGVMRAGFDSMNDLVVIQTAQGLCDYILKLFPKEEHNRGIVFGYDGRHNSERFAKLSASVFINKGIKVWLYGKMVVTPFVPFAILEKQCLAGVMVTASHNPKEDNGYKVYWTNGAQIISPHDQNIQEAILENLTPSESSWDLSILKTSDLVSDPFDEMFKSYSEKLLKNIPVTCFACNECSELKFVYTAMHGVGFPFIEEVFQKAKLNPVVPVIEQCDPDPEFPTVKFPNPEEGKSSLDYSMRLADEKGISIILANDPDADRLACAEKNSETGEWKVFSGNELGSLLGWWTVHCYLEANPGACLSDCYTLASTVSSKILGSMAKHHGFQFMETLTGFKWMGNHSVDLIKNNKTVLFAFEEAIGFMISPTVLDKDGVSAACHLATMACYLREKENLGLDEKLIKLYQIYGYHYATTSYYFCYEPETIKKIFGRIRQLGGGPNKYPESVQNDDFKIASIRDPTTNVDTAQPDGKCLLPYSSSSEMITFRFENGVDVTLRTSGTEPKIKYYAEICGKPEDTDWESLRKILKATIEAVVVNFLQPEINNLTPRSN